MNFPTKIALGGIALFTLLLTPLPLRAAADPAEQAKLEKQFGETLTNAVLSGGYTIEGDDTPKNDRYTILKAVKGDGDKWVITAKIEYKGIGLPVDLSVPVLWAGDTAVISLTDYKVPGLGTFTARVMFYGDHYAGTWKGGGHGGMMWGKIEHASK